VAAVAADLLLGEGQGASGHGRDEGHLIPLLEPGGLSLEGSDLFVVDVDIYIVGELLPVIVKDPLEAGVLPLQVIYQ